MPCPEKFRDTLIKYELDSLVVEKINKGYEHLVSSSNKKEKAEYFRRAMQIFDEEVDSDVVTKLMDDNGCCKTGAREKASKAFFKENKDKSLAEKIELINGVKNMGNPKLLDEKTIYILAVQYHDGSKYRCACPNFNSSLTYLDTSRTYCKCCSGHFRYHYQIMLGVNLKLKEIPTSPLGSNGLEPCSFIYEIVDNE